MVVYSPFDMETQHNPFPVYARMRDEAPVYHNAEIGFYALSRYDDVLAAHLDPATFISSHGVTIEGGETAGPYLILKDPPEHEWHRKVVSRMFTPRSIGHLEPFIRRTASALLDRFVGEPSFDVVDGFSIQLPLEVISELIGIPHDSRQRIHELSDTFAARDDSGEFTAEAAMAGAEIVAFFHGLVADRRQHLGDDIISTMILAEITDADGNTRHMDDEELGGRFFELAFAGHETVARLIANGVVALAWFPDQRRELVADRSLLPNAVEEMLRWDPPSHFQGRWTTADVELHGATIPADSRVVLITGAANHDERRYDAPGLFDIHRHIDRPVGFGFGVHLCLGAALARLETRVAFDELLDRFPEYQLGETGIERMRSSNVRGLKHLPISVG